MRFIDTNLMGAWLIEAVPARDSRGFFARTFCAQEFADSWPDHAVRPEQHIPVRRQEEPYAACIFSARRTPRRRWSVA